VKNNVIGNKVYIFNESGKFRLPHKKVKNIINLVLKDNKIDNASVNVIYCNDLQIHKINKDFLNHDYPTDIITFPIDDDPLIYEMYISIDTAINNAEYYNVSLSDEILRLAAHGSLHIIGYNDISDAERAIMQSKEDYYLHQIMV